MADEYLEAAEACTEQVVPSCRRDLGYVLGLLLREYVTAARDVFEGLPGGQRGFQVLIAAEEGPGRNQAALASLLGLDRTVMTYLIDELVEAGLVERRPDPADRRSRLVTPTEQGRTRLNGLGSRLRTLERELFKGLGDTEYQQLTELLTRAGDARDV